VAAWNRVRRDDAFAYARRVLTNANIDRLRRRRFAEVSDEAVQTATPCAGWQADDRDQLTRLLAVLSTRERTIVVLRYYCDLPEQVVAHELGLAVGTVKSTASRALARLRSAPAGSLIQDTTLSSYERKVLAAYPDAYRAGGAVIWPHTLTRTDDPLLVPQAAIAAEAVPLPQYGYGYFPDTSMGYDHPDWVYNRSTEDHAYEDLGPCYLLCNTGGAESDGWTDGEECRWPSLVVKTRDGNYATQRSFGTEDFLSAGSASEVFMVSGFEGRQPHTLVLGGLDGTAAARVVLDLADGRRVDAQVTAVTSYDDAGGVVDEHPLEACDSPVDCEVR
jgi:hypothetical protein